MPLFYDPKRVLRTTVIAIARITKTHIKLTTGINFGSLTFSHTYTAAMADSEQPTPIEGTPTADVEMGEEGAADVVVGEEQSGLTQLEPETPKLVLFAE